MNEPNALDRVIDYVAPAWALRRQRARAQRLMLRHYEGASSGGRRTSGWVRPATDANAAQEGQLDRLRYVARDLVRNNPYADSALDIIADHVVGWGIVAKPSPASKTALDAWNEWAGTTDCDADGRLNLYGLQKLVMRSVARDGEVLVRRRIRLLDDELALPIQLQVLEADFLDSYKTNIVLPNGGMIIGGVEFDAIGRRVAYWLYPEHPGSSLPGNAQTSNRIPAESVLHIFRSDRPGQARGASWFAPVVLTLKDFDEYTDGQLMKQKVAALLAGVITDAAGGNGTIVGNMESASAEFPSLYPGGLVQAPAGTDVKFTTPPPLSDFKDFSQVTLRAIAAGIGVTYEDISGDYSQVNFSSARMSRLAHYDKVHDWRWMLMIPQFCDPVWSWAMAAAVIVQRVRGVAPRAAWTAPPIPMVEPDKEGLAYARNVRAGIQSLSEAQRERGYDPAELLQEMADDNARLDKLGLVLDSDPRRMTQAGQAQPPPPSEEPPPEPEPPEDALEEPEEDEAERAHRHTLELVRAMPAQQVLFAAGAIDARTTIADGAIQITAPVDARTTVERGAVSVSAPTTIEEGAIQSRSETIIQNLPRLSMKQRVEALAADDALADDQSLTPRQREVYGQVQEHVRAHRARFGESPTMALLARALRLDRKTLREHLAVLYEKKLLKSPTPGGAA